MQVNNRISGVQLSPRPMDAGTKELLRYRFGAYEVNPDSLELHKNGIRMKLREQAFRILVLMLERPGVLITREELRQRVWPDDTFVNFDKSLNTAVNTLRDVLCDSAINPCFVETIPRHGYRFKAEVQKIIGLDENLLGDKTNTVAPATAATTDTSGIVSGKFGSRFVRPLSGAILGLLAAGTLAWFGYRAFRPALSVENWRAVPLASYPGFVRSPSLSPLRLPTL